MSDLDVNNEQLPVSQGEPVKAGPKKKVGDPTENKISKVMSSLYSVIASVFPNNLVRLKKPQITMHVSTEQDNDLIRAIHAEDLQAIKQALEMGADINYLPQDGMSPLILASFLGKLNVVKFLLHNELKRAIRAEDLQAIKQALEMGADINYLPQDGISPLILASFLGKLNVVEFLIHEGANVRLGEETISALNIAAGKGHTKIVHLLLSQRAVFNLSSQIDFNLISRLLDKTHIYRSKFKSWQQERQSA